MQRLVRITWICLMKDSYGLWNNTKKSNHKRLKHLKSLNFYTANYKEFEILINELLSYELL